MLSKLVLALSVAGSVAFLEDANPSLMEMGCKKKKTTGGSGGGSGGISCGETREGLTGWATQEQADASCSANTAFGRNKPSVFKDDNTCTVPIGARLGCTSSAKDCCVDP